MNNLSDTEINALNEALDDEYHAFAAYNQVIADFGEVPPFVNIRDAEARHIEALLALYKHYGLPIPQDTWPGKVERYASLQDACKAGVAAEIANTEVYERLLKATHRVGILTVFRNLRDASQQRHLPAFQRCAQSIRAEPFDDGRQGRHGRHRGCCR